MFRAFPALRLIIQGIKRLVFEVIVNKNLLKV